MTDPERSTNPAEANETRYQPGAENYGEGLPPEEVIAKADEANLAAQQQAEQAQNTTVDQPEEPTKRKSGGKK